MDEKRMEGMKDKVVERLVDDFLCCSRRWRMGIWEAWS